MFHICPGLHTVPAKESLINEVVFSAQSNIKTTLKTKKLFAVVSLLVILSALLLPQQMMKFFGPEAYLISLGACAALIIMQTVNTVTTWRKIRREMRQQQRLLRDCSRDSDAQLDEIKQAAHNSKPVNDFLTAALQTRGYLLIAEYEMMRSHMDAWQERNDYIEQFATS